MFDPVVALIATHCDTEAQRRMLIISAFNSSPEILGKTDYSGSSLEFATRLVHMLQTHGESTAGTQALWQLLSTLKNFVGVNGQAQIDALKDAINSPQALASSGDLWRVNINQPIFISYSRANRPFAERLRQELRALGFNIWRDVHDMKIGDDWWRQIQEALAACHTMVLCMSPAALTSPVVAQEWHVARQLGVRVMPVIAEDVDFSTVPRWMSRKDWADFRSTRPEHEAVWQRFIQQLNSLYDVRKVPFMVEALPADFVPRPKEFEPIIATLVDTTHGAVAITTALKGAGGYGKTTLARAVCHDTRVRGAFDDGILWVTLGEKISEGDLTTKTLDLVEMLKGSRPSVATLEAAKVKLREAVGHAYLLLIIDDVWQAYHAVPFLDLGPNTSTLITTRSSGTLPASTPTHNVDAMQSSEAVQLLASGLNEANAHGAVLRQLAIRLGEWPLLLKLANGQIRRRISHGQTLGQALEWVNTALQRKGFGAFDDPNNLTARNRAAAISLGLSLELLKPEQRVLFERLAIFPEDQDIPFATLEKAWNIDEFEIEELGEYLVDLSLLLRFDLNEKMIRLHDVVRTYLRDTQKANLVVWNQDFLDAHKIDDWSTMSSAEPYLWHGLAYHLQEAERLDVLRGLLLNARYLQAKLDAMNTAALLTDAQLLSNDPAIRLIHSALTMSAHVLAEDKSVLDQELIGRLMGYRQLQPEIKSLIDALMHNTKHIVPVNLDTQYHLLDQAGGPLLQTFGDHKSAVNMAILLPDETIISCSHDQTLRRWDINGNLLMTFTGHLDHVNGVMCLSDDTLLSWAGAFGRDSTLRRWTLDGEVLAIFEGHYDPVDQVRILADGSILAWADRVISQDNTLRRWDFNGSLLATFEGHTKRITDVLILPNGSFISSSDDNTLRHWDISGKLLQTFVGHTGKVNGALLLPDETFLSWSNDGTLRRWSISGVLLQTLVDQDTLVTGALHLPDGTILSWNYEGVLHRWDIDGTVLNTFIGHTDNVAGVLLLPDSTFVTWSSGDQGKDNVLRRWSLDGVQLNIFTGHTSYTNGVLLLPDNTLLSWSDDHTLRRWSLDGKPLNVFTGHTSFVKGVLLLPDDTVLSWSNDDTLRRWSFESSSLNVLKGHTDSVTHILPLPDGSVLSWAGHIASRDTLFRRWNANGNLLATFEGHTGAVGSVVVLPDETLLSITGPLLSQDYTLRRWSLDGHLMTLFEGHTSAVNRVINLPDGTILSWAGNMVTRDFTLRRWSLDGHLLTIFKGHIGAISHVIVLPDSSLLSLSRDHTMRRWSRDGTFLALFEGHTNAVNDAEILPNGLILSMSDDHTLRLWSLDGECLVVFEGHTERVIGVQLLPDGSFLSCAGNTLYRWTLDGKLLNSFIGHTGTIERPVVLPDHTLVSWANDMTLRHWTMDGTSLDILNEPIWGDKVRIFTWAKAQGFDANQLFSKIREPYFRGARMASRGQILFIYNTVSGETMAHFIGDADITCVTVLADQVIVVGDKTGRVMFLRWR